MQGSLDHPPIVLQSRRWNARQIQYLALMLVIFAINLPSLFMVAGNGRFIAYGLLCLVAVVVAARIWAIILPPRLTLSPSGLSLRVAWRTRSWPWKAVRDFRPVKYARIETVGFDFLSTQKAPASRQINNNIAGAQAVLPGQFAMGPIELAGLLNHARERWAGRLAVEVEPAPRPSLKTAIVTTFYVLLIGRVTRRLYWISFGVLAAIQLAVGLVFWGNDGVLTIGAIGCVFLCRGRLRDIGWPAWLGLVVPIAVMVVAFAVGIVAAILSAGPAALLVVADVVVFAAIAPFGFIHSDPKANRYGPSAGGEKETIESVFN